MAKCDTRQLQALAKRLERAASAEQRQAFYEECCRELAARFLAKVIKRTRACGCIRPVNMMAMGM